MKRDDGRPSTRAAVDRDAAREKAWVERGGAIAKGDPNAPPPKAPASGSGVLKPKQPGAIKK